MSTHRIPLTTAVTDELGTVIGRIRRDRTPEYAAPSREDGTGILNHAVHHLRSGRWIETWYSIWVRRDNGGHEGRQAVEIGPAEAAQLIARWGLQVPSELAPLIG